MLELRKYAEIGNPLCQRKMLNSKFDSFPY